MRILGDIIAGFKHAPIKVFLGDSPLKNAENYDAQSFIISNEVETCRQHIEYRFEQESQKFNDAYNKMMDRNSRKLPKANLKHLLKMINKHPVIDEDEQDLACKLDCEGTGFLEFEELKKAWFAGLRVESGLIGSIKKAKGQLLSFTRHITPMIENLLEDLGTTEEVKQQVQNPDIGLYSNNDLTLNLNKPPTEENTLTDIKASVHLYSKEAAARLAELLRLHPRLVEQGEQQKHIWSMTVQCTKSITAAQ